MNRRFILIYRIILFILAFLGVYLEITKYGVGMLMYYTVLSKSLAPALYGLSGLSDDETWRCLEGSENLANQGRGDHVHHDYLCRLSPLASPNCDRFLPPREFFMSLYSTLGVSSGYSNL